MRRQLEILDRTPAFRRPTSAVTLEHPVRPASSPNHRAPIHGQAANLAVPHPAPSLHPQAKSQFPPRAQPRPGEGSQIVAKRLGLAAKLEARDRRRMPLRGAEQHNNRKLCPDSAEARWTVPASFCFQYEFPHQFIHYTQRPPSHRLALRQIRSRRMCRIRSEVGEGVPSFL